MYVLILFMLALGYYSLSYGVYQIRKERNFLGGIATIVLSAAGTIAPIIVLFQQQ